MTLPHWIDGCPDTLRAVRRNPKTKDIAGLRSGKLTVVSLAGRSNNGKATWLCRCDCGGSVYLEGRRLTGKKPQLSCGCLLGNPGQPRPNAWTHGKTHTSEYSIWRGVVSRCTKPNTRGWKYYGARGITICEGLADFPHFYRAMKARPTTRHSIDRIDNDKGYWCGCCDECKRLNRGRNVRWATKGVQSNNRRDNHVIEAFGQTKTLTEWAKHTGLKFATIKGRLDAGWSNERALSEPVRSMHRRDKPILTDATVQRQAVLYYLAGHSLKATSEKFQCGPPFVVKLLYASGHTPREVGEHLVASSPLADPRIQSELVSMYREGISTRRLASHFSSSSRKVCAVLRQHGIQPRSHNAAMATRKNKPSIWDDPDLVAAAAADFERGMGLWSIRKKYGGGDKRLKEALQRHGVL